MAATVEPGYAPHTYISPTAIDDDSLAGFVVKIQNDASLSKLNYGCHLPVPVQISYGKQAFTVNVKKSTEFYISLPSQFAHDISLEIRNLSNGDARVIRANIPTVASVEPNATPPHNVQEPPSFLPLVADAFDPLASGSWVCIAYKIQQWLAPMSNNPTHPLWMWGVDLYWVAFTAAFPEFLCDPLLPIKSSHIPLHGTYIAQWVHRYNAYREHEGNPELRLVQIRSNLWQEFQQRIKLVGFAVF